MIILLQTGPQTPPLRRLQLSVRPSLPASLHQGLTFPEIAIGAFYDPRLLPDYGGTLFRLVHAKLVQRNVVDDTEALIPPWEAYDKLRPGTLVLMKVQLLTFNFEDQQRNGTRKIYQFLIERLRVLAPSTEDMEAGSHTKPSPTQSLADPLSAKRDTTDEAMEAILPSKKQKLDSGEGALNSPLLPPPWQF